MGWGFYGRESELSQVQAILDRNRWFFARITGRRRIGKTSLIRHVLRCCGVDRRTFYVQIPDSGPAGVLSSVTDAMGIFGVEETQFPAPRSLKGLARTIGALAGAGWLIVLDEFQYFNRKRLREFTSHLQAEVDALSANADAITGGLFVLGSIHTEVRALLEDRTAPLYNRTTDTLSLAHLDIASVVKILETHADSGAERLLFLWNLFEGVPKFYRDCYERGVLGADRREVLRKMFFESSSPLTNEAEHWFLSELRGRYDGILKHIARYPGCTHGDITSRAATLGTDTEEQVGAYLKILIDRYQMVEKMLPIFAKPTARSGRYYLCDNFLRAWLSSLSNPVAALDFRPVEGLVREADQRLELAEGHALERLAARLYEERSRKGAGGFPLTHRICGYWDRKHIEIDLVALNEPDMTIRFGTCKRSAKKILPDLAEFDGHIARFLSNHKRFLDWTVEKVAIAPRLDGKTRAALAMRGYHGEDLGDLTTGL